MGLFSRKKPKVSISFTETINGKTRPVSASNGDSSRFQKDMEHLTKDGELPWGWIAKNRDFIDKINSEYTHFLNRWLAARTLSPVEQYGALKSFVMYLNDAKNLCYSKGECFAFWYDNILTTPKYVADRVAELRELENRLKQGQE